MKINFFLNNNNDEEKKKLIKIRNSRLQSNINTQKRDWMWIEYLEILFFSESRESILIYIYLVNCFIQTNEQERHLFIYLFLVTGGNLNINKNRKRERKKNLKKNIKKIK